MHASSAERAVAYEAQAIARCRRYGQEKTEPKLQWEKKMEVMHRMEAMGSLKRPPW